MELAKLFDEMDRRLKIKGKVTRSTLDEVMADMIFGQHEEGAI